MLNAQPDEIKGDFCTPGTCAPLLRVLRQDIQQHTYKTAAIDSTCSKMASNQEFQRKLKEFERISKVAQILVVRYNAKVHEYHLFLDEYDEAVRSYLLWQSDRQSRAGYYGAALHFQQMAENPESRLNTTIPSYERQYNSFRGALDADLNVIMTYDAVLSNLARELGIHNNLRDHIDEMRYRAQQEPFHDTGDGMFNEEEEG